MLRFFQRYYDDRADQDGEAHKCTPELGDPKGPACFRRWLVTQIGSNVIYKMSLTHTLDYYLGSNLLQRFEPPKVDGDATATAGNRVDLDGKNGVVLAWVRTESLVKDLSELWLAVTGRQLPPRCISELKHENPSDHSNICDYYDNATAALVRAADARLLSMCGCVMFPTSACLLFYIVFFTNLKRQFSLLLCVVMTYLRPLLLKVHLLLAHEIETSFVCIAAVRQQLNLLLACHLFISLCL